MQFYLRIKSINNDTKMAVEIDPVIVVPQLLLADVVLIVDVNVDEADGSYLFWPIKMFENCINSSL